MERRPSRSFPDANRLHASWPAAFSPGDTWSIRYALTDYAAAHSLNGLRFTVSATDVTGREHTLIDRMVKHEDRNIHEQAITFPFAVQRITFIHDNMGSEHGDVLWVLPEGLEPPEIPDERWESERRANER